MNWCWRPDLHIQIFSVKYLYFQLDLCNKRGTENFGFEVSLLRQNSSTVDKNQKLISRDNLIAFKKPKSQKLRIL